MRAVILLTSAAWASAARVVLESEVASFERPSWVQGGRAATHDVIDVTFVVKPAPDAVAALEAKFWAVSDPFGARYKEYLSLDEAADLLHPAQEDGGQAPRSGAAFVAAYLVAQPGLLAGALNVARSRGFVSASLYAGAAEELFGTELYHFSPYVYPDGLEEAESLLRATRPYSLPEELAAEVSLVDKLLRLPRLPVPPSSHPHPFLELARGAAPPARSAAAAAEERVPLVPDPTEGVGHRLLRAGGNDTRGNNPGGGGVEDDPFMQCAAAAPACRGATTPAVLRARYGFPVLNASTPGNAMGCTEFQLQGIKRQDLAAFAAACQVPHVAVDRVQGLGGRLIPGVEALLDVEYMEAVASPIPLTVINSVSYSLLDWASALANDETPAWVQSVSYGNDEVQQVSKEYMDACSVQFMLCGTRGLSVLFASGDQGVWGRSGRTGNVFHPDFPAGSPYITAVGGTDFAVASVVGNETAWADGGGGFSNNFARPAYQAEAVAGYLSTAVTLPDAKLFNASGRAYPDVSALAGVQNGYCVAYKGEFGKVGGTSAAAPVVAGAVALLNDELLAAGKPPMGFLNPWIYGVAGPAGAFFDVASGTNNAGAGDGFDAAPGWDPATGYGTPNYPALRALVLGADL